MPSIGKYCDMAVAAINGCDGQDKAAILTLNTITMNSAPAPAGATVAVIGSSAGWLGYSTDSGTWTSSSWAFYDTGTDKAYEVEYGYKPDGTELWVLNIDKTANPLKYSTSSAPSQTSDWTNIDVINGTKPSYGSAYGYSGSAAIATFVAVGDDARESHSLTGDPTDVANWTLSSRINTDCSTVAEIRDVAFNGDIGSPVFVAVTNRGFIASSADGATWTTRRDINNTSKALYRIEYGNGVWVACGYSGDFEHMTGSSDGTTWGTLNLPAGDPVRTMYGVTTNGAGNWIMVGGSGHVWTSSDDAVTWNEQQVVDSRGTGNYTTMYDVAYDDDGTWIIVGKKSEIWKSTDNGSSWANETPSRDSYKDFQSIQFNKTKA